MTEKFYTKLELGKVTDLNIEHITFSKLSKADLKKQFANDARLGKILLIFDYINSLDGKIEENLSSFDLTEMQVIPYNKNAKCSDVCGLDNRRDDKVTDFELERYFNATKQLYGEDVQLDDYRKFIEYAIYKGHENYAAKLEEDSQTSGMSKELIEKFGVFEASEYKRVIKNNNEYYERTDDKYTELRDKTGNMVERRWKESANLNYEGCEEVTTYNEGDVVTESYINHNNGEQTTFEYAQSLGEKSYKIHLKDGVAVRQSAGNGENTWKDMQLEDVVLGAGTHDSTKVSFKYDENNKLSNIEINDMKTDNLTYDCSADISIAPDIQNPTRVSNDTVETLQQILDGGARYGEDFDLKIENGELKIVPKIKNETGSNTPELKGAAFDNYKELVSQGIHVGEDFDIEYNENGTFRYHYKNNQAKGFEAEYKTKIYDKNGNLISSLTVKNGEIIKETFENDTVKTDVMSFDDALTQLLLEKNFDIAGEILGKDDVLSGGYNIYPIAEKYRQITGRELIGDAYDEYQKNNKKEIYNLISKLMPAKSSENYYHSKEELINNRNHAVC